MAETDKELLARLDFAPMQKSRFIAEHGVTEYLRLCSRVRSEADAENFTPKTKFPDKRSLKGGLTTGQEPKEQ